jgi:hypothetical protein
VTVAFRVDRELGNDAFEGSEALNRIVNPPIGITNVDIVIDSLVKFS